MAISGKMERLPSQPSRRRKVVEGCTYCAFTVPIRLLPCKNACMHRRNPGKAYTYLKKLVTSARHCICFPQLPMIPRRNSSFSAVCWHHLEQLRIIQSLVKSLHFGLLLSKTVFSYRLSYAYTYIYIILFLFL